MTLAHRSLVLDANILIRLVLGQRVRELVLTYSHHVSFFTPVECYADARKYLPALLARRGIDSEPALELLNAFEPFVLGVEEETYRGLQAEALARIGHRDERDWPVLAAALVLDCPIWTEDQDFFGTGVPTWTTDRVELYLAEHGAAAVKLADREAMPRPTFDTD